MRKLFGGVLLAWAVGTALAIYSYDVGPAKAAGADYTYTQQVQVLNQMTAAVATATGTAEQVLDFYTLPANSLVTNGQRVDVDVAVQKAANTDSVTCKLYFGSEVISTGANTTSAAGMVLHLHAVKTATNTQTVWGEGYQGTTLVTPYIAAGSETETSAITIKATCTDGTSAAGDATLVDFSVRRAF